MFDGTINLRTEYEQFSSQHNHFAVLRRLERGAARVAAYDELYDDAHREAWRRLGQGRVYTDHIVKARKRTVAPAFDQQHQVGVISTPGIFFYLSYIAKPTKEDWMIEIALGDDGKPVKPFVVVHYYNIMDVEEERDSGGPMSYFRMRVEERTIGGNK